VEQKNMNSFVTQRESIIYDCSQEPHRSLILARLQWQEKLNARKRELFDLPDFVRNASPEAKMNFLLRDLRKTGSIFISALIHYSRNGEIPLDVAELIFLLGAIKDRFKAGVLDEMREDTVFLAERARTLSETLEENDIQSALPPIVRQRLATYSELITIFANSPLLSSPSFHLLRKRIRSFAHSYNLLGKGNRTEAQELRYLKLVLLTTKLGKVQDNLVRDTLLWLSREHDPTATFESLYAKSYVTLPEQLKEDINELFAKQEI
jgi:hypothetical protein